MSYSDDDKEVKIGEEEDADFEVEPNDPLNDPLIEDDDLVGTSDDPYDSEFTGLDDSEY
jgi:hypothetical protein